MSYELRPMSFGEILDTGFRVFRDNFKLLFALSLLAYAPMAVLEVASVLAEDQGNAGSIPQVALLLDWFLVMPFVNIALVHAVGELYLGQPANWHESARFALSIWLPVTGTTLLFSILVFFWFSVFVLPGVYFAIAYSLREPVMVFERQFGIVALRRSRALLKHNWWRAIGILAAPLLLAVVPVVIVEFAFVEPSVIKTLISNVAQAVCFSLPVAFQAVFYFDLRCRKEAFDLQHLADLVEQRAEAASAA